jgi:hypothetical protein
MTKDTQRSAPTRFAEAAGVRFVHGRFGAKIEVPPALLHAIAASWIAGPEANRQARRGEDVVTLLRAPSNGRRTRIHENWEAYKWLHCKAKQRW